MTTRLGTQAGFIVSWPCAAVGCLLFAASAAAQPVPPPFAPPTNLQANAVGPRRVDLTWVDPSPAPMGFRIERRASPWSIRQDRISGSSRITETTTKGQTFTALGPHVDRIGFYLRDVNPQFGPIALSVTLYEGVGFNGRRLATEPITGLSDGFDGFYYADMSAVQLQAGATYTARLQGQNGRGFAFVALWRTASGEHTATDPYSGGFGFESPPGEENGRDFAFRVLVDPTGPWTTVGAVPANATSFSDTSVSGATTYEYRVRANPPVGSPPPCPSVQVTTPAALLAPAAEVTAVGVSPSRVDLTWTDESEGEVEYRVERRLMHDALPAGARAVEPRKARNVFAFVPLARSASVAREDARDLRILGASGFLATITHADEHRDLVASPNGRGWLGGTDAEIEGTWRWVTDPEEPDVFWVTGSSTNTREWGWAPGEPDDGGVDGEEDHMYLDPADGLWRDHGSEPEGVVDGYFVEFYTDEGQHPDFVTVQILLPPGSSSFSDLSAESGVAYEYRVVAIAPNDDRAPSAIVSVRPPYGALKAFVDGRDNLYQAEWPGNPYGTPWPGHDGGGSVGTPGASAARCVRYGDTPWDFAPQGGAVSVTAFGRALDDGSTRTGPNGGSQSFRGLPKFALIGIWSSDPDTIQPLGQAFFVGASAALSVPPTASPAYLFLAENDGEFADNSGGYQVTVRVQAP